MTDSIHPYSLLLSTCSKHKLFFFFQDDTVSIGSFNRLVRTYSVEFQDGSVLSTKYLADCSTKKATFLNPAKARKGFGHYQAIEQLLNLVQSRINN